MMQNLGVVSNRLKFTMTAVTLLATSELYHCVSSSPKVTSGSPALEKRSRREDVCAIAG